MTDKPAKDELQVAFDSLEHVFLRYKNDKAHESNRHPSGSPSRLEADLSEVEKAHLGLLQSKLQVAIAQQHIKALAESAQSSDSLGRKVVGLNLVVVLLSFVVAASAVMELSQ